MYAILILVAITVGGHQHKFSYTSKTTYAQEVCDKRSDEYADRISRRIAKRVRPVVASVKAGCTLADTRSI